MPEEINTLKGRVKTRAQWALCAERAYELGLQYERTYHGCGQCTLAAVQEATHLFDPQVFDGVFEAATGLAGGIGLCGEMSCSAFNGGALVLGLFSPRRRTHFDNDRQAKYRSYALIQRLRDRFMAQYGVIRCQEIHQVMFGRMYDLRDPVDQKAFANAGAHSDKCPVVVARAARWVVEIIAESIA